MVDLQETIDAREWAKEFMRLYKKFGYEPDEEMMRGWFANAIMVGYGHGYRRSEEKRKIIQKSLDNAVSS